MHQSIPAVPIPPPGQPQGICSNVSPGGGALAILSQPGGWALAYPGATPGHLTHVFFNQHGRVCPKGRGLRERLASPSRTRKTCGCF